MRRTHAVCLAVVIGLAWNAIVIAQKGGPKSRIDQSGTASFRCNEANPPDGLDPCEVDGLTLSDRIRGDGAGPYVGVGVTAVSGSGAFLRDGDGEFVLELRSGGGRFIYLNFEDQHLPPSGTFSRKTFTKATLEDLHFNTNVLDLNGQEISGGLTGLQPGESRPARIKAYWTDPYCNCDYTIRFNAAGYPGSTNVTVVREDTNTWTIEAFEWDIAQLVSPPESSKGKPTGPTNEGFYHLPFKITFTVP